MPDMERLDIVDILLDSNLKAIATYEAILRWCNSSPETSHAEALCAIEQLVTEAMKGRGPVELTSTKVDRRKPVPVPDMRPHGEIERARDHFAEVYAAWDDIEMVPDRVVAGAVLDTLSWVLRGKLLGPDFDEMLKDFDAIAPPRKPS